MREDFALELNAFKPGLPTLLFENFYRLEKLSEEATQKAILEPIKKAGYTFEEGLQEKLLENLLSRELARGPHPLVSDQRIKTAEPPYLQIVCSQLWQLNKNDPEEIIRLSIYEKSGMAQGLLGNYIQQELNKFTDKEKKLASRAFDYLVSQHNTKMAYTVKALAKTLSLPSRKENDLYKVLEKLRQCCILRSQKRETNIWYELYHDMFSESLEIWNTRWKNKRNISGSFLWGGCIAVIIIIGYHWYQTNHYHLRSKNFPDDRLEIYQGNLGLADWFGQPEYVAESRYQRKQLEPVKCIKSCDIFDYEDLNNELIGHLPLLDRITAYAESGQFGLFDAPSGQFDKTAFALIDKTLKNKNRAKSIAAIKRLGSMLNNEMIPKLVHEWQKNSSSAVRDSSNENLPDIATTTLLQGKSAHEWREEGDIRAVKYLTLHGDWVENEDDWILLTNLAMSYESNRNFSDPDLGRVFQILKTTGGHKASHTLIKLLANKDSVIGGKAVDVLGQIKTKEATKHLIKALEDKHSNIRRSAVIALSQLKASEAIQPLIRSLSDENKDVRRSAAHALKELKAIEAIQPLIDTLADKDWFVRRSAVDAIVQLKAKESIQPLIKALENENKNIRSPAADALIQLQAEEAIQPLIELLKSEVWYIRRSAVDVLGQLKAKDAIQPLIKTLADKNWYVRSSAADALGMLKTKEVILTLVNTLSDENSHVRSSSADALGQLKAKGALQALVVALGDKNKNVRISAATALGSLMEKDAIQPLIRVLDDMDSDVRRSAVNALSQLGAIEATKSLVNILRNKDENTSVRRSAANALAQLNAKEAIPLMILALGDDDSDVRRSAISALSQFKEQEVIQPLLKVLENEKKYSRLSAIGVLGQLKAREATLPLIKVMSDENNEVRESVVYALGQLRTKETIQTLIKALSDESSDVRHSSIGALGQLKTREGVQSLILALGDENSDVRRFAIDVLGQIQSKEAIQPVIKVLMKDDISEVRHSAIIFLEKLGGTKALSQLIQHVYSEERTKRILFRTFENHNLDKPSLTALTSIVIKDNLHFVKNWQDKLHQDNQNKESQTIEDKVKKTPEQWLVQLNNSNFPWFERRQALDQLAESNNPELARQSFLNLLQDESNHPLFEVEFYQYLADLHITESLSFIQGKLDTLDQQWKNWRKQRDGLSEMATEKQRLAVQNIKPLYSAYTYAPGRISHY